MAESCQADPVLARKSLAAILQALASAGQKPVADALGVSEATVSRMKGEWLENFTALLGALNLKVIPAEHKCYAPEYIDHLHYFAKRGMEQANPAELQWD
jgi:hypothetical protein